MPDDLDLRSVHGRHEPDPAFRSALRLRVEEVVAGQPGAGDETDLVTDHVTDLDNGGDLIMLTDTRTEDAAATPPRGKGILALAAVVAIVAAVAAVAVRSSGDDDDSTLAAGTDVVFDDTFDEDDGRWQTDPEVALEDGQQVWTISTPGQLVHLHPFAGDDLLVDMEVTAEVAGVDPASTVGVHCRKGPNNNDYYHYFRVGPAGAVIGTLPIEGGTPGQVGATAPEVRVPSNPFTLGARCVDIDGVTQLTLLLDGEPVLSATYDTPLPAGTGSLEVQAGPAGSAPSEVRWERFTVEAVG